MSDFWINMFWSILSNALFFYLGYKAAQNVIAMKMAQYPEEFEKIIQQIKAINSQEDATEQTPEMVACVSEVHDNITFIYEKDTGKFLAQGSTLVEAMLNAGRQFPNKRFWHPKPEENAQNSLTA